MKPPTTDDQSSQKFRLIVAKAIQARWKENDARRVASQPEPENPLMCDLLSMRDYVVKAVGGIGAGIRKNKEDKGDS